MKAKLVKESVDTTLISKLSGLIQYIQKVQYELNDIMVDNNIGSNTPYMHGLVNARDYCKSTIHEIILAIDDVRYKK